jgi:hypothetical protein
MATDRWLVVATERLRACRAPGAACRLLLRACALIESDGLRVDDARQIGNRTILALGTTARGLELVAFTDEAGAAGPLMVAQVAAGRLLNPPLALKVGRGRDRGVDRLRRLADDEHAEQEADEEGRRLTRHWP